MRDAAADLIEAVRALLDAAPTATPEALVVHAGALRERVEDALCAGEDIGLLNDAVVAVSLYARARQRGETEGAEEWLEQARLFLEAASQGPGGSGALAVDPGSVGADAEDAPRARRGFSADGCTGAGCATGALVGLVGSFAFWYQVAAAGNAVSPAGFIVAVAAGGGAGALAGAILGAAVAAFLGRERPKA